MTRLRPEDETLEFMERHFRPEERIVLFVGRASYEKGGQVLIDAAKRLRDEVQSRAHHRGAASR